MYFRWNQNFNPRFVAALFAYGNFYFNVIALVMALLLLGNTFNFDVQMIRVMLIAHLQN